MRRASGVAAVGPVAALGVALLTALPGARPLAGQDTMQVQIRQSQERLAELRRERERLEREMENLVGRARDISTELASIERQRTLSASALRELDTQTAALASSADDINRQLIRTRDRLQERNVVLGRRLRDIYEQGPLHAVRVLLSAENFGDLLNRYKYLHLISVHDRMLLEEIAELETNLTEQDHRLRESLARIEQLRAEKLSEFAQLQYLEQQQARTLENVQGRVAQTETRIQKLAADEERLSGVIENLERLRIEAERRRAAAGAGAPAGAMSAARDFGALPWPIQGELLYRFGPERRPNGVTLRRNGIGIRAAAGTEVRAVKPGTVAVAGPVDGFNRGVILSHGQGYYTVYLYLGQVDVVVGQDVRVGQRLGTVGPAAREEAPHLYFQVLTPIRGQAPIPVDPLPWLRARN